MTRSPTPLLILLLATLVSAAFSIAPAAAGPGDEALADRFAYLSERGNSNCSAEFEASIGAMASMQMLQGSCCSPMDKHRYVKQVQGLRAYRSIEAIPMDPYDISAGQAQQLMAHFSLNLTTAEQAEYDYAMANSDEKGPCCCACWRWKVYGGLGKHLIREHGFTGPQVANVWDLSDGCGGGAAHEH